MMNQTSYINKDNIEQKYTKALIQIKKVHNANQLLRNQLQKMKNSYENQLTFLHSSLDNMQKDNKTLKEHQNKYLYQIQTMTTNQLDIKKQLNDFQKQIKHLNELINIQIEQSKKHNPFKQDKSLVLLICSYEQRQQNYKKDIQRYEQVIKAFKLQNQKLQNEFAQQRRTRLMFEELNNTLKVERDQYKDVNVHLIAKHQTMITNLLQKNSHQGKQKMKEAEQIISQLKRYLESIKMVKLEHKAILEQTVSQALYNQLLEEKVKLNQQNRKLRQNLQKSEKKQKQLFLMQEKMNKALFQAEQSHQECIFLKNKIILLETKQIIDSSSQLTDPLNKQQNKGKNLSSNILQKYKIIDNISDPTNFQLMKTFIIQLNQKIQKLTSDKRDLQKKNNSLKQKLNDKTIRIRQMQQLNISMNAKIEGLQALTQKSYQQLQLSVEKYQEQLGKLKSLLYNVINKKTLEQKITQSCISNNLSVHSEDKQLVQSKHRKEIQTLNSQLTILRSKTTELNRQIEHQNHILSIYKKKIEQINQIHLKNEQTIQLLQDNCRKYQKLYQQQKIQTQRLQKQLKNLSSKRNQIIKSHHQQDYSEIIFKNKQNSYINEINRLNAQLLLKSKHLQQSFQTTIHHYNNDNFLNKLHGNVRNDTTSNDFLLKQLEYMISCKNEQNIKLLKEIQEMKVKLRQLDEIKIKLKHEEQRRKYIESNHYQHVNNSVNNNYQHEKKMYQYKLRQNEIEIQEITNNFQKLMVENKALKKNLESIHKQLPSISSLNKSDNAVTSFEKIPMITVTPQRVSQAQSYSSNLQIQYNELKIQKKKSQQILQQIKRKQSALSQQFIRLRNFYQQKCEQCEQFKNQLQYKIDIQQRLNSSIDHLQMLNQGLNQDNSNLSFKLQEINKKYSYIKKQIENLKYYLSDIQLSRSTNNWQEQQKAFFDTFLYKIKNIVRICQDDQRDGQIGQQSSSYKPYVHFDHNPIHNRIYQSYDYIHNRGGGESFPYSSESYSIQQA